MSNKTLIPTVFSTEIFLKYLLEVNHISLLCGIFRNNVLQF